MKTALVLAGHGSHISPNTAGLVWEQVDRLRVMGIADEVTAAFWKEAPSFHTVFNSLCAEEIVVVPLFTAQGYFTQTVIPAEMGLTGEITHRDGHIIRYTRTLSEHPYLASVVRERVVDGIRTLSVQPEQTAVAIIGHSTRRNPESRKATEAQAEMIRATGLAAEVEAVFLDDSPEIAAIYGLTRAPNLVAVPFFLASGSHTSIDVPRELGLRDGEVHGTINGRQLFYTSPVGTDESLTEVILELAREAGASLGDAKVISAWGGFPTAGREELLQAVTERGEMQFGQLHLTATHVNIIGDNAAKEVTNSPARLRERVRENPFRSLATANDLRGGWRVPIEQVEMIHAVIETVYPGTVADWAAGRKGTLKVNTFRQSIGRQTGNYRQLEQMNPDKQAEIVSRVCGNCVRHPTWFHGESPIDSIPCPEPCNHWLSAALEDRE